MIDDYFFPQQISKLVCNNQNKSLLITHFNTRSLAKNDKLNEEFITEIDYLPEMISISETKLNVTTCIYLNIPFYNFFRHDSPFNAGVVGIYVKQNLNYRLRADISLNVPKCDDIWIEVSTYHGSIIFTVIYRHPKTDFKNFQNSLCNILIELENKNQKYVERGNINVNLKLASTNSKLKNYFNLLSALGSIFLIKVSTPFSKSSKPSLLDHIYYNITKKELIGKLCLFEIFVHLPTCSIIKNFRVKKQSSVKLKRCMNSFDVEKFIFDLNDEILNTNHSISLDSNVNKSVIKISEAFMNTLNKHAPCRRKSRHERKLNEKL